MENNCESCNGAGVVSYVPGQVVLCCSCNGTGKKPLPINLIRGNQYSGISIPLKQFMNIKGIKQGITLHPENLIEGRTYRFRYLRSNGDEMELIGLYIGIKLMPYYQRGGVTVERNQLVFKDIKSFDTDSIETGYSGLMPFEVGRVVVEISEVI